MGSSGAEMRGDFDKNPEPPAGRRTTTKQDDLFIIALITDSPAFAIQGRP
jgi:hypothetical protein